MTVARYYVEAVADAAVARPSVCHRCGRAIAASVSRTRLCCDVDCTLDFVARRFVDVRLPAMLRRGR